MFFSMWGSRPLKVNSWINSLMWSWSFRVRHIPWLPALSPPISEPLSVFARSVLTEPLVQRPLKLLEVSSWRGWLSMLLDSPTGRTGVKSNVDKKKKKRGDTQFIRAFTSVTELNHHTNLKPPLKNSWQQRTKSSKTLTMREYDNNKIFTGDYQQLSFVTCYKSHLQQVYVCLQLSAVLSYWYWIEVNCITLG